MKSIVEEASSITKAIEKAWLRAQKPREFSIKIFEEAETNFFGMTKKPAKIGFFYKEELPAVEHGRGQQRGNIQRRPFNKRPSTGQAQGSRDEHRNDSRSADGRREQYNAPRNEARPDNRQHPRSDNRHHDARPARTDDRPQHNAPRENNRSDYRNDERREQQPNTQAPHDAAQTQDGQPRPQRRRRRFRRGRGGQGGGQSQNTGESRSHDGDSSEE